jgi:hypothetical protein
MSASELIAVLESLNAKIEATKHTYDLMVELREVISGEFDLMYKQQSELKQSIETQLDKMKALRETFIEEQKIYQLQHSAFIKEKAESEAILIAESLKKLEVHNKLNNKKRHTLFSNVFPIGTLGQKTR